MATKKTPAAANATDRIAELLAERDHGRVVGRDRVTGRVLDRGGEDAGGAGGEVRGRAGENDVGGCAVDDGEGSEGAGGEAGGGGFHRDAPRQVTRPRYKVVSRLND